VVVYLLFSFLPVNYAKASDWSTPAFPSCEVIRGKVNRIFSALQASEDRTSIGCPLTKEVDGSNLRHVYVRLKRASISNGKTSCVLGSTDLYGSGTESIATFARDTISPQSVAMRIPTLFSSGYLVLFCNLNKNDVLYGIRYGQN